MRLIDAELRPGLLVSVRDAREAIAALEGGAQVIDVKEPRRGSLGAADNSTIEEVVAAVGGRAMVTAAAGELTELFGTPRAPMPPGVSLLKIGLAGCREMADWRSRWLEVAANLWQGADAAGHTVAVAYADWRRAGAPSPVEVLRAAVEAGCPAVLVDTWDKSHGPLFDHWPADEVRTFCDTVRSHGMAIVLAGSLQGESLATAAGLAPDLIAVRTAACAVDRSGPVLAERVAEVRSAIRRGNRVEPFARSER